MRWPCITVSGLLVVLGFCCAASAGTQPGSSYHLHSSMPAGFDVINLKPSGVNLSLMGLIECPELEGAQPVSEGMNRKLVSTDGDVISRFPQRFSFRVTASLKKLVVDAPSTSLKTDDDPRDLLLKLKFRIRAYDGLEVHELLPESVEMIGMPADVQYDERIYRLLLNNVNLPITDRLVLEIFSPQGEMLTHFSFSPL